MGDSRTEEHLLARIASLTTSYEKAMLALILRYDSQIEALATEVSQLRTRLEWYEKGNGTE